MSLSCWQVDANSKKIHSIESSVGYHQAKLAFLFTKNFCKIKSEEKYQENVF